MDVVLENFENAQLVGRGDLLSHTLIPAAPASNSDFLQQVRQSASVASIETEVKYGTVYNQRLRLSPQVAQAWQSVYVAYWHCVYAVLDAQEEGERSVEHASIQSDALASKWIAAYNAWNEVVKLVMQGYQRSLFEIWTLPCLYVAGKYLRVFAIRADEAVAHAKTLRGVDVAPGALSDDVADASAEEHENLEDAARAINNIFSLCARDRAPINESRKWALYNTANLLFKTYFRLNSLSLPKNVLASIATSTDVPPLSAFPKSHQVTFHYYHGVVLFLSEDYAAAEGELSAALALLPRAGANHPAVRKNRYLVLTYLIPCRMITSRKLPSPSLLASNLALQRLFAPLCTAIQHGDLAGFDAALSAGEAEFAARKIYLTLERGRDLCLRNVLRKVLLAAGWEEGQEGQVRKSRIPIQNFIAGVRVAMGGKPVNSSFLDGADDPDEETLTEEERDEVECLLANAIYKNLMKGYIARGPGIVVLSKGGAFPGTTT